MRSPVAAVGWEFQRRHRWGLRGVIAYMIVLAAIKLVVIVRGIPIYLDSAESFAFVVVVPLTATFTYFLAMFTFGLDGDLAARQSMFPARRLTLPVTTTALAGWPMIYGSATIGLLWLATRAFALWPSGFAIPTIWPALLAVSLLAWTQALTWMPYPLPGLRIVVVVVWLSAIDAIVLLALTFHARELLMVAIIAPQIPLAYVVARLAVARARRGDVPDWRGAFASLARVGHTDARAGRHFSSPAAAQTWFEWRRHGWSLPTWVAIVLPFELVLLWVVGASRSLLLTILVGIFLTPPFVATFAAAAVSKSNSDRGDSNGVAPFVATRPLSSAELVAAKLKMAIGSTVVAWLLVLITVPIALKLSGTSALVLDTWHHVRVFMGMPRAVVLLLLILAGCIAATWTQLVQGLFIGLTGRASLIKASVFLVLGFFVLFGPFLDWITDSGRLGVVWSALPLIFGVLVAAKMTAAVWIGLRLYGKRLLKDRTLVAGAASWCVAVFALYGVLVWMLDTPHIPHYLLMLVAILTIPLVRVSAAPVALSWNRHR
ncbi:MAG TPA: hypothetical protein VHL32_06675 [Gemmatimonadaceae bacterium]|nr:hypothetical protein [Gemmatimonadaceae bacterium]